MLKIDCLLKNTEVADAVKSVMEYIGATRVEEGKDASVKSIFNALVEGGVEIDLGSTAAIYADVLSTKNHPSFNTRVEVEAVAGKYFDDLSRNLLLRENKTGEKKISELSPAEAVFKNLTGAFTNRLVKDERTKSILKKMQDAYMAYAKKHTGKLPEAVEGKKDERTFEEVIRDYFDMENLGYTDKVTGTLNGFNKLDAGAKEILKKMDKEVAGSGDRLLQEQWDAYMQSFADAARTLIFSTKDGQKVLHESLKTPEGGGYVKTLKDGTEVLDHEKLAGNVGSISQYRDNVIKALTAKGFNEEEATKVADSLQKEYVDLRANSLEIHRRNQERKDESYRQSVERPKVTAKEIVDIALQKLKSYAGLKTEAESSGEDVTAHAPKLAFSKKEATTIAYESLKNSEYGKDMGAEGARVVDWLKLAQKKPDQLKLNEIIHQHLMSEGVDPGDASKAVISIWDKGLHDQLMEDIATHSKSQLDARQNLISKERAPVRKSDMKRLAELHAMGIFEGAHDDLLHHVLGIEGADQETRQQLIKLFEKKQQLIQATGGHEFLTRSLDAELQHDVNQLIEENIADKTKAGKVAKALYDYQNLVNMGIIANAFNIAENTTSGLRANMASSSNIFKQLGTKEGVKIFYEMQRLWWATLKDVSRGGVHYGLENGKFSHASSIADKATFKNWEKLGLGQKAFAVVTAYARLGLSGMDSAYKAAIHQKTTILNLHHALTHIPDENGHIMTKEEANEYLNEKLFGKSLDDARNQAEFLYKKLDIKSTKNNIERSARELVQANLYSDGQISDHVIEAATRSAYRVAAISLGHEAQPGVLGDIGGANMIKSWQNKAQAHYDELVDQGKYNAAAAYRILTQTMIINGVFKFAHGVANWLVLRPLEGMGIGIVRGGISKRMGKSDIIDWNDKKQLESAFTKMQQANMDISRGLIGLTRIGMYAGALGVYGMLNDEDKSKGNLAAAFKGIKKNPILNKAMNKFGADVIALMYISYTAKNKSGQMEESYVNLQGFLKYLGNATNVGSGFSLTDQYESMQKNARYGNAKGDNKAAGIAGNIAKTLLLPGGGEIPFYRSYKGIYYLGKSAVQGKAELPPYYTPQSLQQGFMNNGLLNDIDEQLGLGIMYPKEEKKQKPEKGSLY